MASGIQKKIREANSITEKLKTVEENLKVAEKNIQMIHENDQKNFGIIEQKFNQTEEILDALIVITGMEQVFEQVKAKRIEKAEADAELKKTALEAALKEGQIVVAEEIGDKSIIIGTEVDKDGNQLHPIRAQLLFAQIKSELAEPLRGKKVGDTIDTPVQSKFTVTEIYDIIIPTIQQGAPVEEGPPSDPLSSEAEEALLNELAPLENTPLAASEVN